MDGFWGGGLGVGRIYIFEALVRDRVGGAMVVGSLRELRRRGRIG